MTIFTRDLIHRIITCVLLPILFRFLPCATCQQESNSEESNRKTNVSGESILGIILLATFLSSMVACCLFFAYHSAEIETGDREVLHSRARHGLDKDAIESFPSFLYLEVKGFKIGKGGVECAICLTEFEDEEILRWMPHCSHTFHANCIDVWLSSQSTCPVCRANLSVKPDEGFPYPSRDIETGNAERGVLNSPEDISLIGNSETNNNNATPRSRSTGFLSSWRIADIFFPRSHSTGHSMVQLGENLDRFTLQLPEEVQRQLVSMNLIRTTHMALPRARSSRQGYRSSSVGSERINFSQGRQTLRRAISMSFSFSFQAASVQSTRGRKNLLGETSQAKDIGYGERSFERLMQEKF